MSMWKWKFGGVHKPSSKIELMNKHVRDSTRVCAATYKNWKCVCATMAYAEILDGNETGINSNLANHSAYIQFTYLVDFSPFCFQYLRLRLLS